VKIGQVGAELFHADGQTGTMNLIVAFRNLTNTLKNQNSSAQFSPRFRSRGSVMRIVTRLDVQGNRSWVPGRGKRFISLQSAQNGPGAHPHAYSIQYRRLFLRAESGRGVGQAILLSSAEF